MVGKKDGPNDTDGGRKPNREAVIIRIFRAFKRQSVRQTTRPKKGETDHQRNERMMAGWTRRVGIFTIVLAGVAVIGAVISYYQWRALHSTDEATHIAASAAKKAAESAATQAEAALQALRPYMSYKLSLRQLDDFSQPIAPNEVPAAALLDVEFTNHGSMAAKVADVRLKIVITDRLPIPPGSVEERNAALELRNDALPAETLLLYNVPLSIFPEGVLIELNEDQQATLKGGKESLFVYGNFRFNNYVKDDAKSGPHDFFFGRKYRFYMDGRKRPGFTYEDVPRGYASR
jgi:hypothetical protein